MESIGNTTIQTLEASNYNSVIDDETHIFNGTPQLNVGYSYISTMINASGAGILKIHHSMDAETWDITDEHLYGVANQGMFTITPAKTRYFYVQFINTTTSVNSIRLQTFLRNDNGSGSGSGSGSGGSGSVDSITSIPVKYIFEQDISIASPELGWSIDSRQRSGWYFSGSTDSALAWYTGPPMTLANMSSLYIVLTLDSVSQLPTIRQITTSGNDETTWTYSVPLGATLYTGQTYQFYYGNYNASLNQGTPVLLTRTKTGAGTDANNIKSTNIIATASGRFLLKSSSVTNQSIMKRFEVSYETVPVSPVTIVEDTFTVRDLAIDNGKIINSTVITADIRGREGWWWAGGPLDIKMYDVTAANEKQVTFSKLKGVYYIFVPETIAGTVELDNGSTIVTIVNMPVIYVHGSNGSSITYGYDSSANVFRVEPVMFYKGSIPDNIHKTIPRFEINQLASTGGPINDAPYIDYINIRKPVADSPGSFLLQYSGYIDIDLGRVNETRYVSGNKRKIETNLSALTVTPSGALVTQTIIRDASNNPITSQVSGQSRGLDVNVLNTSTTLTLNYKEAIVVSGSLAQYSVSGISWTRGDYGNKSVLSYKDLSVNATDTVSLFSVSGVNNLYLGSAYPINISGMGRNYCFNLNLLPYDNIRIRNDGGATISGVYAVLRSA